MKNKIIVIDTHLLGDLNTALGVALAISKKTGAEIEIVKFKARNKVFKKLVQKLFINIEVNKKLQRFLAKFFFKNFPQNYEDDVSYIISILGNSEVAAAYLARFFQAQSIHIGSPKKIAAKNFSYIISNHGDEPKAGEVFLPVPPTRFFPEKNNQQTANWLLLLGGDSPAIKYSKQYWDELLSKAIESAKNNGKKLQIVTSRRTPDYALGLLKKYEENVEVYYYNNSQTSLKELLEQSCLVLVTAESMSMIADALAYNIPVCAIKSSRFEYKKRVTNFLKQQALQKNIAIHDCEDWSFEIDDKFKFNLDRKHFSEYLLNEIKV